jgi:hypothetical protein
MHLLQHAPPVQLSPQSLQHAALLIPIAAHLSQLSPTQSGPHDSAFVIGFASVSTVSFAGFE